MSEFKLKNSMAEISKIRAHHLRVLREVEVGNTPQSVAGRAIRTDQTIRALSLFLSGKDCIGSTRRQRETHREGIIAMLSEIHNLSADQPVRITTQEKDKVCTSCAFGKHCEKPSISKMDQGYLVVFERRAERLHLADTLIKETDAEGRSVAITAPAGVVREVAKRFNPIRGGFAELRGLFMK
jgi:hypothetical protein